jgi:hypothetical protein
MPQLHMGGMLLLGVLSDNFLKQAQNNIVFSQIDKNGPGGYQYAEAKILRSSMKTPLIGIERERRT